MPLRITEPFPPFGEQLRNYRTLRGLSVEEVAVAVGVSPTALREIENGVRRAPSVSLAKSLVKVLDMSAEEKETFLGAAEWESGLMGHLLGQPPARTARPPLLAQVLVFLIADIRGYSRFTEERGDQAAARLTTRFAELAQTAVELCGGQFLEVRGDEVLAVFASAQQAVKAAADLQRRCGQESLTNVDLPLAIGVGLDVGEVAAVDGGYRGVALNRAARLCSLAGAGEVLVSTGVAYLVPQLDGISFVPRGEELLKGFSEPTSVLLLAAPVEGTITGE